MMFEQPYVYASLNQFENKFSFHWKLQDLANFGDIIETQVASTCNSPNI